MMSLCMPAFPEDHASIPAMKIMTPSTGAADSAQTVTNVKTAPKWLMGLNVT